MDQSLNMVKIAYDALDDKLAEDIKIIDIRSISVLADYFIIADGNNKNQVQAMVDNVQEELFKAGYEMKQMEGYREGNWILLTLVISSSISLIKKTVYSMILKESGKTEKKYRSKN